MNSTDLLKQLNHPDRRALARCISIVENNAENSLDILKNLNINNKIPVIGITGPPGAGKSTLVNALISATITKHPGSQIAVLAVDPTSPFNYGSLLGDRLRMNQHFNNPNVYIRSIATRGALGGLSAKTIEITDILRSAGFDYIFIETVGVGQSEVEIASLADTTLVVFVPESGDEIQTIKSGIMEIADIFVVNKADRDGADHMVKNLRITQHEKSENEAEIPVVKTIASADTGISELLDLIEQHTVSPARKQTRQKLLDTKAVRLLEHYLLRKTDQVKFLNDLHEAGNLPDFNLYRFVSAWIA